MTRPEIESLGALYLGREIEPGMAEPSARPLLYDSRDLTTHALCVGMTGSGKTGLCLSLIEEAALDNIPVIAIDPKGDLSNLALRFPKLDADSFAPWIDEAEAAREGVTPQEYAQSRAELWKNGLASWDQDGARIERSLANADLQIFTPGSEVGLPLSILTVLDPPAPGQAGARERLQSAVSSLLSLVGVAGDPLTSREHVFLSNVVDHYWQKDQGLSLSDLVRAIADPPFSQIGVLDIETFFARAERQKLMMRFNNLLASPGFAAWTQGEPLNVERLLWSESGKARTSVLSIAHLSDDERMFFVSLLLGEIVSWMRAQSGTPSLRAILYMDEVFGFFPPVQNPPSKAPMLTLLKQARAYGLGIVLATQNPVDLDYKGLSNCGTWFLGRLQTERDKARLLEGLASAEQGVDPAQISTLLSSLQSRVFLMHNVHDKAPVLFHTRWVMSYLRGPLTLPQIGQLMAARKETAPASPTDGQEQATAKEDATSKRPVCPTHIRERVLDTGPELLPALLAHVKLHHRYRYSDLDAWSEIWSLYPHTRAGIEWRNGRTLESSECPPQEVEAADGTSFGALPQAWLEPKAWKALGESLQSHLYEQAVVHVYRSESPKLYSRGGETKEAFAGRVAQQLREARDEKIDALQAKFEKQRERLEDRVQSAEVRVEKERSQYESAKVQSTISIGGTILGALFGRKITRSATSSARSVGRAAEQKGDIARAQKKVDRLRDDIAELDEELRDEIEEVRQSPLDPQIETIEVPPLKSDIDIELVLAWVAPDRLL